MNRSASTLTRLIALLLLVVMTLSMVACDKLPFDFESIFGGEEEPDDKQEPPDDGGENQTPDDGGDDKLPDDGGEDETPKDEWGAEYADKIITIAKALELCKQYNGAASTERYYIRGFVKSIDNANYGAMTIEDETGSIYVYGSNADDGTGYSQMTDKPYAGDEVILSCTLQIYNNEEEVKNAIIVDFRQIEVEVDLSDYTEMTVAEARSSVSGTKVKVSGVVARLTYAFGMIPSGAIVVDGTQSIYVYDKDFAARVAIGDAVEVYASKTYWILDSEQSNAKKYGYKGCNQLDKVVSVNVTSKGNQFDTSWITETTVKEIMETPVTEDITTRIFKVNALIKKVEGANFVNYYIYDIDGVTGSYAYTQCSGSDFSWLDEFNGKICTVYLTALNAKSTGSGCNWRFLPVSVIDEGYQFDTANAGEYAVKYHAVDQFVRVYNADPALELITSVSSPLLGFEGATLSYSSSNEDVVYFEIADGKTVMHCVGNGEAVITVTGKYGDASYSEEVNVSFVDINSFDYVSVADAIAADVNSTVLVRGIVGPGIANQKGFYIIDESGSIPVVVADATKAFAGLEIGHEVILQGTRSVTKNGGGQICINNASIVANLYGKNNYSTESFIKDKTIDEIKAVSDSAEATLNVYIVTATVAKTSTQNGPYTNVTFNVGGLLLYTGNAMQYSWIEELFAEGETQATLTVELALCDWNARGLKGCVLAVVNEDGSKVLNPNNFN